MKNYKNIFTSIVIIVLVFVSTIFTASRPFISLMNFQRVCAQDDNFRKNIAMVVDRSTKSRKADLIASQMIDEAISRHIKVSILGSFGKDDCNVERIGKIDPKDLPIIADTFNYENNSLSDFVDVVNTCKNNILSQGKCVLVVNPLSYMTNGKFDNDKFRYYLETIKSL